jgi:hypothetical protein
MTAAIHTSTADVLAERLIDDRGSWLVRYALARRDLEGAEYGLALVRARYATVGLPGSNEAQRNAALVFALEEDDKAQTCRRAIAEAQQFMADADRELALIRMRGCSTINSHS